MDTPKWARKLVTAPLTRADAELLHGSCWVDGRLQTVEEIMQDKSTSKVIACRDIDTGKMKLADENHNNSGIPFYVVKTGD